MLTGLLHTHITFAFLSLTLLVIRGLMQWQGKDWRTIKLLKILPHLADTILVLSGIGLVFAFGYSLQLWIIAKVILLIVYAIFAAKYFHKNATAPNSLFLLLAICAFLGAIFIGYSH
ncbi:SirB2 family protein [Mannheimia massilioguelmaensis]|uniref:SirB2 family protein n=1 Tax=Mannheimia massilioguelmaensis TaxID=1604354 RepID=UPI0005CA7EA9|nr:SirB2 family protein [Mannheimia massilioguelmaensis]